MEINKLLVIEGEAETQLQSKVKSLVVNAVKKHGIDKEAVMTEIRPEIAKIASDNTRFFLKLGVDWLK